MYLHNLWIAANAATQWKVSIMKFRMTLASVSLSTAILRKLSVRERTGYSAVRSVMPKSITISTVLMVLKSG